MAAAGAAADKKASDIRIFHVGDLLGITDYFVLLSASNDRQMRSVAEEVEHQLKLIGSAPVRREGTPDSGWLILDYGMVVVHVFGEEQRAFYGLERLWGDAPELEFSEAEHAAAQS